MNKLSGIRSKFELSGILLTCVSFGVYLYFGMGYHILNSVIAMFMVLSLCVGLIAVFTRSNWLILISEVLLAVAAMVFIRDAVATFVDWYNGTAMFGGTGRIDLVFTVLGFAFGAILVEIFSCFMKDKA